MTDGSGLPSFTLSVRIFSLSEVISVWTSRFSYDYGRWNICVITLRLAMILLSSYLFVLTWVSGCGYFIAVLGYSSGIGANYMGYSIETIDYSID